MTIQKENARRKAGRRREPHPTSDKDGFLTEAIHLLGSRRLEESLAAERKLERMGVEAIKPLVTVLQAEIRSRRRRRAVSLLGLTLAVAGFVAGMTRLRVGDTTWMLGTTLGYVACCLLLGSLAQATRRERSATRLLRRVDDVRAIAPLLEALRFPPREVTQTVLIRLLRRLRADDRDLLDGPPRSHLHGALKQAARRLFGPCFSIGYIVAVLKALEQIGDAAALPYVEFLAFSARQPDIRIAAQECLPFLRARAEQTGQTLLRPTDIDTADTLLRSTGNLSDPLPSHLLRPLKS
ncbi:MAG TPA: hypothetical protein VFA07_11765 [Chthonomonadaceae bacterium]|nr:hypothetical protein [Chthonomonadaceae bacterium]